MSVELTAVDRAQELCFSIVENLHVSQLGATTKFCPHVKVAT